MLLVTYSRWNDHTRPACIADASHTYAVGDQTYLPGWGSTESKCLLKNTKFKKRTTFNRRQLPVTNHQMCLNEKMKKSHFNILTNDLARQRFEINLSIFQILQLYLSVIGVEFKKDGLSTETCMP